MADNALRQGLPPHVRLFGRGAELAELGALLDEPGANVCVVGPPGAGKTALVSESVRERLDAEMLGAIVWVPVDDAPSADELVARLVRRVGGTQTGAADALATVAATLRSWGDVALVFDGAERARDAVVPLVETLLGEVPLLRLILTSREPTRCAGEEIFRIGPLTENAAIELFSTRVADGRRRGTSGADDVAAIAELVERLDRLPLAIELAASRGGVLSIRDMTRRLDERFRLLRARPGEDRLGMEAALDWSWEMLEPWEVSALVQATVFRGDFTLSAAEAVIDLTEWQNAPWTLDVVASLFDRSLIRVEHGTGQEARYALYASMLDYAKARADVTTLENARRRHAEFYVDVARDASAAIAGADESEALAAFDADRANILSALEFRLSDGGGRAAGALLDAELLLAQRLTHQAHLDWLGRAVKAATNSGATEVEIGLRSRRAAEIFLRRYDELARKDVERCEELIAPTMPASLQFGVRHARGYERYMAGEYDEALQIFAQSREIAEAAGHDADVGRAWLLEGMTYGALGDLGGSERLAHYRLAREAYARALEIFERRQAHRFCAAIYGNIGNLHMRGDERAEQRFRFEQALEASRRIRNRYLECVSCANLAWGYVVDRKPGQARELLRDALEIQRGVGRPVVEAVVHLRLGVLEADVGNWDAAVANLVTAREVAIQAPEPRLASDAEWWLALVAWHTGRDAEARTRVTDAVIAIAKHDAGRSLIARHLESVINADSTDGELPPLGPDDVPHLIESAVLSELFDAIRRTLVTRDVRVLEEFVPRDESGAVSTQWLPTARVVASAALCRLGLGNTRRGEGAPHGPELLVGPALSWLQVSGRERVALRRRRVVRRLAECLVRARQNRPAETVSVTELIDAGWPGQKFVGDSAANRVYVTIATLRQLGLGDALQTVSGGYRLDPSMPVVDAH